MHCIDLFSAKLDCISSFCGAKLVSIQFIEYDIMTIDVVLTLILILIAFFLGFDFRNPKITHRFLCLSTYGKRQEKMRKELDRNLDCKKMGKN